MTGATLYKTSI